jgi:hypothetical protein
LHLTILLPQDFWYIVAKYWSIAVWQIKSNSIAIVIFDIFWICEIIWFGKLIYSTYFCLIHLIARKNKNS